MVYEVANLLNSRPIGIKPGYHVELGVYLCPNDFLLGHNSMGVPPGTLCNDVSPKDRMDFIQSIHSKLILEKMATGLLPYINCETKVACGKEKHETRRYSDCSIFQSIQG